MNTLVQPRAQVLSFLALSLLGLAACQSGTSPAAPSSSRQPSASLLQSSAAKSGKSAVTLDDVRRATARFHNIDVALASGYVDDGFGCIDSTSFGLDPSVGGMGFHLINWALHDDPETDPERPDLLVYEPADSPDGRPNLVALEYELFRPDWYAAGHTEPPTLFGHEFESLDFDTLQVFALHIWLWRDNPSGMFQDFNPKTSCFGQGHKGKSH